jgi:molybdopterin/thiamine biosynthesis adenylyltransferase
LIEVEGKDSALPVLDVFSQGSEFTAKWKRLQKPPPVPDAPSLVEWVRTNHSDLLGPTLPAKLVNSRYVKRPKSELVGLLFSEEGPEVGEERDAWIFLFVPLGAPPHLIEHQVVSLQERQRRIPSLALLVDKSVVVVGLGALGAPVATELAKCGTGNLEIVDFDRYDVNNTVRHVLTTDFSGLPKTLGIGALSQRFNPFCVVTEHLFRFGDADWKGQSSLERFEELVGRADLVIETTGSHQLQRFIGRICLESAKPFISCWLTDGYLGGHVVRIVPGETCCYLCYATALANKELPMAEASENASVTAQGCSHPTTTGAGFDATELAAIASRLAVQTMLHELDVHDHIVVNFYRDGKGLDIPRFLSERLVPTDGCDRCGQHAGFTEALAANS